MIYFDNAATSLLKPPQVAQAVVRAMEEFGGAGRGVHEASLAAGMAVYEAREKLAALFGAESAAQVVFCLNATAALNMLVDGLLGAGDHALTTAASHNSVLRPLHHAKLRGGEYDAVPLLSDGGMDYDAFAAAFKENTRFALVTHASNLTGDVYDIARIAEICHSHGALCVVDAAQSGGSIPVDMQAVGIDALAFAGHKHLFGPQGVGGLCLASAVELPHGAVGGTGSFSFDLHHPDCMPERLEAGTLNSHGIAGLSAGLDYIASEGLDALGAKTAQLSRRFIEGAVAIEGITLYRGCEYDARTGIVALNLGDIDSGLVSDALARDFGICTRAGSHCAPLMHHAFGTTEQGIVRFSFSSLNTEEEIDQGIAALRQIAQNRKSNQ